MKKEIEGKIFWEDAKGGLIPEENVKPVDQLREQVIDNVFEKTCKLQEMMKDIKRNALEEIQEYVAVCAEKYNCKIGGTKGNISLVSYDGTKKVVIAMNDTFEFNEQIEIAKTLIYECINSWSDGANRNLVALVDKAFRVTNGKLDVKRILDLRTINIEDERWEKAMEAINDALVVRSSKQYMRLYSKNSDGSYEPVNLDFSDIK